MALRPFVGDLQAEKSGGVSEVKTWNKHQGQEGVERDGMNVPCSIQTGIRRANSRHVPYRAPLETISMHGGMYESERIPVS